MSPLEQFKVKPIFELPSVFGLDLTFTNSSLFMSLAVLFASMLIFKSVKNISIVPCFFQAMAEMVYVFVRDIVIDNTDHSAIKHMPFVLTMFLFILFCNLIGMLPLPMVFTATSQIVVTLALSLMVFCYVLVVTFAKYRVSFFSIFLPAGTPRWLSPLMFLLEFSTYLFRPASLAIRLAANMVAGHTIIEVIASFMHMASIIFAPFSFVFIVLLIIFEIFISMLQAYIFVVLTCIYLGDAYSSH
ncbi:F0F1 ATP synthase subunit A [Anaplasmataceae bacterium AB001_6]|nr:F0F1 ATP synthase subunit A [Anaplasmataceae bacterium AB001_6]